MEWKGIAGELISVLGLQSRPVAITFTNEEVDLSAGPRTWICRAMKLAARGKTFVIDAGTSACPGGSWHCGLTQPPAAAGRRALQHFLTRGEKLTHSIVSFQRMQGLSSPPPTGLSERIVFCPLDESPLCPDLVLFVCNAEQACRLIALDHFWDGRPPDVDLVGSLCHAAIGYPVMTGNTNVTFGDWTARRMQKYPEDAVFVTVPYERMHNLVKAIPECSAGNASVEIPEEFRVQLETD
ncbi:MAG: DUF169 domain-containing protein [Actinobacteria bacterium]|nr:DUF169 domain-containing protein [Actinomycetota bacterium]MBU1942802.1 DUF169 domain-containing protein [Actinomycetota bacterium]MBU2686124.1 DUF169 domain-containing protein [Actinomycetota bacterium]